MLQQIEYYYRELSYLDRYFTWLTSVIYMIQLWATDTINTLQEMNPVGIRALRMKDRVRNEILEEACGPNVGDNLARKAKTCKPCSKRPPWWSLKRWKGYWSGRRHMNRCDKTDIQLPNYIWTETKIYLKGEEEKENVS